MFTKKLLRNSIANLLFLTGLTEPKWRGNRRFSIATFHRVLSEADRKVYPYPGLAVTPEELDSFLAYFSKYFDCGSLAIQHERFLSGEVSERPLLAITFDDAQYDNYCNARAVLDRHQLKASFFAPVIAIERQELLWHDRLGFSVATLLEQEHSGREKLMRILTNSGISGNGARTLIENIVQTSKELALDKRLHLIDELNEASGTNEVPAFARLMTFKELAELAADGHEIGSHSMTHCLMPECDDSALAYEVTESRNILQTRLCQPIDTFCYPNGNSDARTAHAVSKAGYRRAVTTSWGYNDQGADQFQLRRFNMNTAQMSDSDGKLMHALIAFRMSGFYPGLK
jgi:peptidoglycan/xylan/chitin deacetylase (PgdA/CDA1 family)